MRQWLFCNVWWQFGLSQPWVGEEKGHPRHLVGRSHTVEEAAKRPMLHGVAHRENPTRSFQPKVSVSPRIQEQIFEVYSRLRKHCNIRSLVYSSLCDTGQVLQENKVGMITPTWAHQRSFQQPFKLGFSVAHGSSFFPESYISPRVPKSLFLYFSQ